MYDDTTADEALEESATDVAAEDDSESVGDAISMPTLQRGER